MAMGAMWVVVATARGAAGEVVVGLNIGLFQFSSQISVTLVSVLFTDTTIGQSYIPTTFSLENVIIYLFHKFFPLASL